MMNRAIAQALKCREDVPVGALIVKNNEIISMAYNEREIGKDVTLHAEIMAIRQAENILGNWRLDDCEIYVTLEPCPMCAWAILQARIKKVYFGSYDKQYGALGSAIDLREFSQFKPQVYGGIMEVECDRILKKFFEEIR